MSSSLLFSMLVKMDASQAKAEFASVNTAIEKTGQQVGALPAKTDPAKVSVQELGRAYDQASDASEKAAKVSAAAALAASRAELLRLKSTDAATREDISAAQAAYNKAKALDATASAALAASRAQTQVTGTTQTLGRSHDAASGSVGNLVAQFNDIGMMIAAGQNPLQLAIQQGTQISQVIGPMGASGAVRALGSAFIGLFNPINFITLAVIASGAAFAQWAMSGSEAAKSFEDHLKDITETLDAIESYDSSNIFSGLSLQAKTIRTEFETILGVVRQVEAASLQASLREMKASNPLTKAIIDYQADADVRAQIGAAAPDFSALGLDSLYEAKFVLNSIAQIQGQTREELLKSLDATAERIALIGYMTPEVQQHLALIAEQLGLEKEVNSTRRDGLSLETKKKESRVSDRTTASEMLADLQAEADLNAVIAEYGAQSTEATAKRAEQERAAYVEKVKSLDASDQMRLSLVVAYDAAQALASVDMTSGIAEAANSAATLARNLGISVENASKMLGNGYQDQQSVVFDPRDPKYDKFAALTEQVKLGVLNKPSLLDVSIPSRTATTGATNTQTDSVAKLIEKLQSEVDVSRELDPIQREMAQYRTQLAGATEAERQKVEALITTRLREREVTESLAFVGQQTGNTLIDALMGGAEAGERLIDSLKRAALQALILGQGPLAGLFGGGLSAAFSLFSGPATGSFGLPFAEGGMIYGAGGPRADQVPVLASAGEFIVNARATAQHRPLLERINNGAVPAFADGGIIGGGAGAVREAGSVHINIDARGAQKGVGEEIMAAMQAMVPQIKSIAISAVSDQMRRGKA